MNMNMEQFCQMMMDAGIHTDAAAMFRHLDVNGDFMLSWDEYFPTLVCGPMCEKYASNLKKMEWNGNEHGCGMVTMDKEHQSLMDVANRLCMAARTGRMSLIGTAIADLRHFSEVRE